MRRTFLAAEAGRQVIKVPSRNTSQLCSGCGEKVIKSLSVREHQCPSCRLVLDRDFNVALNIKAFGQRAQALNANWRLPENYKSRWMSHDKKL